MILSYQKFACCEYLFTALNNELVFVHNIYVSQFQSLFEITVCLLHAYEGKYGTYNRIASF